MTDTTLKDYLIDKLLDASESKINKIYPRGDKVKVQINESDLADIITLMNILKKEGNQQHPATQKRLI